MTDLFSAPDTPVVQHNTITIDVDAVKAKFNNNLDDLAKAKAEADAHIKRIEQEQAGLRKELETRLSLEQFMDEIKSNAPSSNATPNQQAQNEDATSVSKDDVMRLVKETYKQELNQSIADRNRTVVADGLRKIWGNDFQGKLQNKAQELGLSKEQVNSLASQSPQALLALMTPENTPIPSTAPPSNQVRNSGSKDTGVRNSTYYSNLRKSNPNNYWSIPVQRQMHNDANLLGDEFYSST